MPGPGQSIPTRYLHYQFISCGGLGYAKELFKFRCTFLIEPGTSVLYGLKYLFHVRVLVY